MSLLEEAFAPFVVDTPNNPRRLYAGRDKADVTFLKFESETEMLATFAASGIVFTDDETGEPIKPPQDFYWDGIGNVSILGVINNDDAVFDDVGIMVTPPTSKPGWHVNVLPD